jgi:hypothetical protein
VIDEINEVSPAIGFLDRIDPSADDAIINFSLSRARAAAWSFASSLAPLPQAQWGPLLGAGDLAFTALGRLIARPPGILFNIGLWYIRIRDSSNVAKVIRVLTS